MKIKKNLMLEVTSSAVFLFSFFSQVDNFMRLDRLKLFVLLSGMMVWKSTNHLINLCEDIDWKRCLALHLW